ncbi:type I-E CRISPR-associated protein Cas7/Cse4/CasC [Klugiella xanthotipulae]|uniref:CRISPR system Cascade subunit CasC n=1 Tax=Klugiella xanthotipulae TaxID=244735 RepID=A0A543HH32_9MICO|nr:type I-E CRISPR-associated protein Cas7/Cse4/CasC [Klugiella xanthotipulae]TQM57599.1 CRISPR system Cascade subunit CasC [Klugiella xanthotipulae]
MTRTIIDIDILHTVPPSNLNRDDTGSPKSAIYGGVRRARVSSQAWKRATRLAFSQHLDPSQLGERTKRVVEVLADRVVAGEASIAREEALALAGQVLTAAGIKLATPRAKKGEEPGPDESQYLLFLSSRQVDLLAEIAIAAHSSDDPKASIKAAEPKKKLSLEHSVDISLFGRMVADSTDLNVDAAAQVAHAISVHAVENEFDYFTAVDDHKQASEEEEDSGAAMIGNVEFNSSTLYRYATVDANRLNDNLGSAEATRAAVEAFVKAFASSMPTGKQNSFANRTVPDAVVVSIRDSQSVNMVGAFEEPVVGVRIATAAARLAAHTQDVNANFGTTPVAVWVVAGQAAQALTVLGEKVSLDELVARVGATVAERITAH